MQFTLGCDSVGSGIESTAQPEPIKLNVGQIIAKVRENLSTERNPRRRENDGNPAVTNSQIQN